jgi:hypothetical protein
MLVTRNTDFRTGLDRKWPQLVADDCPPAHAASALPLEELKLRSPQIAEDC